MATDHDRIAHEGSDAVHLANGLGLAGIALVSAAVTATLVIALGGAWLDRSPRAVEAPATPTSLIRATG